MKTVTFYSYKGGVGRTLLMVNLARYLMSRGKKLVLLDCDLEAPGLHYKFDYEKVTSKVNTGVVDFFHQFKRDETLPEMSEMLLEAQTHESGGSIHIVPAGDIQTVRYWQRLSELDWRDMLYEGYGFHLFLELRRRIAEELDFQPDYLFIDSRTGITEVGGVVTTVLPDALVCIFINNTENIEGTREVLRAIQRSPSYLPDERRTQTVPVLSRIPLLPENDPFEPNLLDSIRKQFNEEAYQLEDTLNVKDISVLHIELSLAKQERVIVGNPEYSVDTSPLLGDYLKLADFLFPGIVTEEDKGRAQAIVKSALLTNPKDGAELVYIPAGKFLMGDDDIPDNPRHEVELTEYYIYKNLVTVEQYAAYCKAAGLEMPSPPDFNFNWSKRDHPMVKVNWYEARAYALWAGGDLPSEAQWERVARGTDGRQYPWGDEFDGGKLWCSRKGWGDADGTTGVGKYGVSPEGCTDMAGNVWQWCLDTYEVDFWCSEPARAIDPVNAFASRIRILRGGSWDINTPDYFRCAHRVGSSPSSGNISDGFRVVFRGLL